MKRLAPLAAGAVVALAAGPLVAAPSNFGCANLDEASPQMVEGKDGTFFRLTLDFRMNQPLSDDAAGMIGKIAAALRETGTELIYVPVPTKSLAMPDRVPESVGSYGFDMEIAEVAYDAFLTKMADAGVTVIDTMRAMRGAEGAPFLRTDFHWTPEGAQSVARAVRDTIAELPAYDDLEKGEYETRATDPVTIDSRPRDIIQEYCRETVPAAKVEGYETTQTSAPDAGGDIFASESSGPPIALAGTSMSAEESFHFEGFLSQESGLAVANYSKTGGNQFGGITSYLLSEDFQENPPAVLIWENPIYNNLGEFGDMPLRELYAPVAADCTPLDTEVPSSTELSAKLPDGLLTRESFVKVDTGSPNGREAVIHLSTADGVTARTPIHRPVRYAPTRWFYQYAAPAWRPDFTRVDVSLDRPATENATLSICKTEDTST
jgi:alginate biosynthesis protein AlgX